MILARDQERVNNAMEAEKFAAVTVKGAGIAVNAGEVDRSVAMTAREAVNVRSVKGMAA